MEKLYFKHPVLFVLLGFLVQTKLINRWNSLQIEDLNQAFRLKQTEEADHQKRIINTRRIIVDLKAELAKVGDKPDVTPRINEVNVELRRNQVERRKMEGEKSDLHREKDNTFAQCKSELFSQTIHCPNLLINDWLSSSQYHIGCLNICFNIPVIVRFGEKA